MGMGKKKGSRLRELFKQVVAEMVSNSRNKFHQTWERKFSPSLYNPEPFICNIFLVLLRPGPRQSRQVGAHGRDGGAERGPLFLLALRTGDTLRHDVVHLEVPEEHRLAAPRGSDAEDHDGNTAKRI